MDGDGDEVLRGALGEDAAARYDESLGDARRRLLVRAPGGTQPELATHADGGALDPYAVAPAARDQLLGPAVVAALAARLGAAPLLVDAAETAAGAPDAGPHRDSTYVGLQDADAPLAVVVVALGEARVRVFPGSQRIDVPRFSGRHRHFNAERDGDAALAAHREALAAGGLGEAHELELQPGDVAVWDGLLVHEPVDGRALVAHCCPASVAPVWFAYRPDRAVLVPHGDAWLASNLYDLRHEAGVTAESAPAVGGVQPGPSPEAAPAWEPPARRTGGLVGGLRDRFGRRSPPT